MEENMCVCLCGRRSSELLARRIAHLAVAAPPLFMLIGVVFYLLHSANGDSMFW
ncbi:MAG: hypothetical protein WCF26_02520 [Candidatus Sulfotelmatobacter sp.]